MEKGFRNKEEFNLWCLSNIKDLMELTKFIGRKYTRSKVRKALPANFRYILEELMVEENPNEDKKNILIKYLQSCLNSSKERN